MRPSSCRSARSFLLGAGLLAAAAAGCASDRGFALLQERSLDGTRVLQTSAEHRVVISRRAEDVGSGSTTRPVRIVCAEPSPDVAKAFSSALNLAAALEAAGTGTGLPVEGAAAIATSLSRSQAQALAQLTNRLATIQLLRDGLYRACEAYANGALTPVTYAVLLSRFDDTMVTLLSAELMAGNFGQPLAALGTDAGGAAASGAGRRAQEEVGKAQDRLDAQLEEAEAARTDLAKAEEALARCKETSCADQEKRQREADEARARSAGAERESNRALTQAMDAVLAAAVTWSRAGVTHAQPVGTPPDASERSVERLASLAGHIRESQRKYLENINADALLVACLTEMARRDGGDDDGAGNSLLLLCNSQLPSVFASQARILEGKVLPGPSRVIASCSAVLGSIAEGNSGQELASAASYCTRELPKLVEAQVRWEKLRVDQIEAEMRRAEARAAEHRAAIEQLGPGATSAAAAGITTGGGR